jgi:hypothetical protein
MLSNAMALNEFLNLNHFKGHEGPVRSDKNLVADAKMLLEMLLKL